MRSPAIPEHSKDLLFLFKWMGFSVVFLKRITDWNSEKKILMSILSDLFSLRQAKFELVKIQIQIFPHGLEVHLDIFWVLVWFLPWAEISGMQIFGLQEQSQEGVCLSLNYLSPQDFYFIVLFLIITFTFEIGLFSIK